MTRRRDCLGCSTILGVHFRRPNFGWLPVVNPGSTGGLPHVPLPCYQARPWGSHPGGDFMLRRLTCPSILMISCVHQFPSLFFALFDPIKVNSKSPM